jgi:hypothetical protein
MKTRRKKITRALSTKETRKFWRHAERMAKEVSKWPEWKRSRVADIYYCS